MFGDGGGGAGARSAVFEGLPRGGQCAGEEVEAGEIAALETFLVELRTVPQAAGGVAVDGGGAGVSGRRYAALRMRILVVGNQSG